MKFRLAAACTLLAALLTGCQQAEPQEPQNLQSIPDRSAPDMDKVQEALSTTEETKPGLVYYITDHETVSTSDVSHFLTFLEETGYTLETDTLMKLPIEADAVILNSPREDITAEELAYLDSYMDEGGHILFLMPADERELRYKNLELLLDEYCIEMDYDILSETLLMNTINEDPEHLQMTEIGEPTGMVINVQNMPLYMHQARSFHLVFRDNYSAIKQDAMLETLETAIGTPYGGTEDDPLSYEGEQIMTMVYSRNDQRMNSTIIAVGSSDFLLDENCTADSSLRMLEWTYASIDWFVNFLH